MSCLVQNMTLNTDYSAVDASFKLSVVSGVLCYHTSLPTLFALKFIRIKI